MRPTQNHFRIIPYRLTDLWLDNFFDLRGMGNGGKEVERKCDFLDLCYY